MEIGESLKGRILVTTLEKVVNWAEKSFLWPATFGLACCAIEMMSMAANRCSIARLGTDIFRVDPRRADLLIIAGTVTKRMLPEVIRIYEQMLEPRWVIYMGSCATSRGLFGSCAVVRAIDEYLPVDVYLPDCPPMPEALLYGIVKLQEKIGKDPFLSRKYSHVDLPDLSETLIVSPHVLIDVMQLLRDSFSFRYLIGLTAFDSCPAQSCFQVVYHLWSCFRSPNLLRVEVEAVGDPLTVPSVSGLWSTANWLERECHDLFGITFTGQPDLQAFAAVR